jgi:predicted LPLAT superfamily acyltransferase
VKIVWINEPNEMLFALKEAAETSDAIAMQCDRVEFSSRAEVFDFLGARRLFHFTSWHLAHVFQRPVILSVGTPVSPTESLLHDSPVFWPDPDQSRDVNIARGREHFQAFLHQLEELLRENPFLWFNFLPLNPPEEDDAA